MNSLTVALAAIIYAQSGWYVFPVYEWTGTDCACPATSKTREDGVCLSAGKHPRTPRGHLDATRDPAIIEAWWTRWPNANIGVATGPSLLVVIDIDPRHGGDDTMRDLLAIHGELPRTPIAKTGGGGWHYLFKAPSLSPGQKLAAKLGIGIDVKADRGFVVLPPSTHISGRRYSWLVDAHIEDTALAPLPSWLLQRLLRPTATPGATSDRGAEPHYIAGQRNLALTRLAGAWHRFGVGGEVLRACLGTVNSAYCDPPLSDGEVCAIAASISKYAPGITTRKVVVG